MTRSDRRLIEDYLPVDWLSTEASGEPRTKGHISTLHLWRARRPLVACRAAVYSALVRAPKSAEERESQASFLRTLCQWGAPTHTVQKARRQIRMERDHPPRVLDLFAGGGCNPARSATPGLRRVRTRPESGRISDPEGDLRIPATIWRHPLHGRAPVGWTGSRASPHRHFRVLSANPHSR